MSDRPIVHLVDASPYIFRAYFSLPASLVANDGSPANAVYGFGTFLLKLIAEERATHVGVAFDESLTTSFRNEVFPAYKAQRVLPPAELEAQLKDCQRMAEAVGAATYVSPRYEADDLIAAICRQLRAEDCRVVVVSSDKDLAQLVGERVNLLDYGKGLRLDAVEVKRRYGVRPEQVPDLLGLAGDAVDNIPGVRGVGAKTAAALLERFGDLDELYANLDDVPGLPLRGAKAIAARLAAGREAAFLSRQLATVHHETPADGRLEYLRLRSPDPAKVDALFDRIGFASLRERVLRR